MKWKMIHHNKFEATHRGYFVTVMLGGIYPYWEIWENGKIVDNATRHSPVTTNFNKELACKVQAEKCLDKIPLTPQPQSFTQP